MTIRTEELILNVGPQHPSTHGVFRLVVKIDGETITEAIPVVGYLHRGTEKLAENLNYTQIIPYTDRMDYVSAMTTNYVLVHAVETMMGLQIPERAEYLRVTIMELQRIASHLLWWGTYLLDLGALSPFLFAMQEREKILALFSEISGARITYNYMRVGGVKWDVPDEDWFKRVRKFIDEFPKAHEGFHTLVTGNEIIQSRLKGIGKYDTETAIKYSLSGVNLRSTGMKWDLRKDQPYSIYDRFDFNIPVGSNGDLWDRYNCRMAEMEESRKIVDQALQSFPTSGEIMAKVPKVIRPPVGETFVRIESPRGEIGTYVYSKNRPEPYRLHFRRPSMINLQILPELLVGENIANMVAILGGIDIILGEVDC